ncbi:hypothetical protein FO440_22230 [Mucilaginibacter corticis]|uniref:Uncharacterized protein n=1 Tax=Mucilaginibacter corticis TaxID=2597670 RepID=A0A556M9H1_9SPHI|nr:hypothetical protein FO440_22230 [Mucilaginibacter corticis]
MKALLLLSLLLVDCRNITPPADTATVYICDSRGSKRYHLSPNCKGLRTCSHRVVKLSLKEAKSRGKTLCGWEK